MRARRTAQTSLFEPRAVDHPVARDLERASAWLDEHPELLDRVAADVGGGVAATGRHGLTCETILRCAVLKHLWQHSYRSLEFLLRDSVSAQRFARVEAHRAPGKTALQAGVGAVRAETWERIGEVLLAARPAVAAARTPWARSWTAALRDGLVERVVDQTRRRVFDGETVPASEKVASLFEPHTDIIRKGGRRTHYGHKVNLATGRSGLVLDAVVEDGNPADSERCLPMLERHVARYGAAPTHAAFDGGYATKANLAAAKKLGVAHAVFHRKSGLRAGDMTPSAWVYARLRSICDSV